MAGKPKKGSGYSVKKANKIIKLKKQLSNTRKFATAVRRKKLKLNNKARKRKQRLIES